MTRDNIGESPQSRAKSLGLNGDQPQRYTQCAYAEEDESQQPLDIMLWRIAENLQQLTELAEAQSIRIW
jgi:hypothetical protein